MTTQPGFSSRNSQDTFHQLPQRDGVTVTDIAGMDSPGWSNSEGADHAPTDVTPEVAAPPKHEPGFSNAEGVAEPTPHVPAEGAIVTETAPQKTTARKTTQKKG